MKKLSMKSINEINEISKPEGKIEVPWDGP